MCIDVALADNGLFLTPFCRKAHEPPNISGEEESGVIESSTHDKGLDDVADWRAADRALRTPILEHQSARRASAQMSAPMSGHVIDCMQAGVHIWIGPGRARS